MMKKIALILLLSMCLACIIASTAAAAEIVDSGTCGEGQTWTLDDEGTLTISGTGETEDYRISYYVTLPDPAIYTPWYDHREDIRSVVISSGVTRIGNSAFTNCSQIAEVTIPDTVTEIGRAAFGHCSALTEIILPDSVRLIGSNAFAGCTGLETVHLGNGLTEMGDSVFFDCRSLTSVGQIPSGVTILEEKLFEECVSLSNISLPQSLVSIKNSVFYNCKALTGILFPSTLTEIGIGAFMGSGLTEVTIPGNLTALGGRAFANTPIMNATMEYGLTSIPSGLLSGCKSLRDPVIPSSVKEIGDEAFYHSSLRNIVIPEGVESIGNDAFNCSTIETISLPDSLLRIGDNAFRGKYQSVYIPSGVQSIGSNAFFGTSLREITVSEDNRYFSSSDGVLYNKDMTVLVQYPYAKSAGVASFSVPDGVTKIGDYAFTKCTMQQIVLPDSLTEIGYAAFCNCDRISTMEIPEGVQVIPESAFDLSDSLANVRLPASLSSIEKNAFANCPAISAVDFTGARCQWERVSIESGNTELTGAQISYAADHVPERTVTILTPATCTSEGKQKIAETCSVCGESLGETTETIEKIAHALVHHDGKAPTTAEPGWEPYETCENCAYTTFREIPPLTPDPYKALTFQFKNGVLTVSGSGTIPSLSNEEDAPFAAYAADCRAIVISDGVSAVAADAFAGLTQVDILILNGTISLSSNAFIANTGIDTVICTSGVQITADAFFSETDICFYEPKEQPHTGTVAENVNVIPYSFAYDTLSFEGRVASDTYGLLDLMAVMSGRYAPIRFVKFTSYTSLDVPFYVFNKTDGSYILAEDNTLSDVRFSVKIPGENGWDAITFNEFCALADSQDLRNFRLVADIETGEEIKDSDFEIRDENPFAIVIKRVLKWITSLLNKLFRIFSKF